MNQFTMKSIFLLIFCNYIQAIDVYSTDCIVGCSFCKDPKTYSCVVCKNDYEMSVTNNCILDIKSSFFQIYLEPKPFNCILYNNQKICLKCWHP